MRVRAPGNTKPSLTPHQQKEARKRLEAGETQRSVARSYNVSQSTISRLTAWPAQAERR
jgi:DNA invertase Pin-like site-specific DNA recombinase